METSKSYPAGVEAPKYRVGDFILTHHGRWIGAAIRWCQGIRFRGDKRAYTFWNHAALIVSDQGDLVEALTRTGATRSHISKYKNVEYTLVSTHAAPLDQTQIIYYADRVVGEKYGYLNDFCVFVGYLTGNKLNFGFQGQIMCSALVARAMERMGAYFNRLPDSIAPADLAQYYSVKIPPLVRNGSQ